MPKRQRRQFEFETEYSINYTTREPVPISDIIDSLRSIEKLLKRSAPFIEAKYSELEVLDVQVYVSRLEAGSLSEYFIVRVICGGRENAEELDALVEKITKDNSMLRYMLVAGVTATVTYGVLQMRGDEAKHTVDFNNNTIINVGAKIGVEAGDIQAILDATTDKKALARESVGFFSPAKNDPKATIEMDDGADVIIPPKVIEEAPREYQPPTPDERSVKYSNVQLVIYASDRDKWRQNWGGIVPGVVDSRVRFILDDQVDPAKLHGRTRAKANITVVSKFNKGTKAYEPAYIEIHAVD